MADWVKKRYGVLEERWQFVETDAAVMQSLQQVCSTWLSQLYITPGCCTCSIISKHSNYFHICSHLFFYLYTTMSNTPFHKQLVVQMVSAVLHSRVHACIGFVLTCMLKCKRHMLAASFCSYLASALSFAMLYINVTFCICWPETQSTSDCGYVIEFRNQVA